jgi:hypothetical protein
MPRRRVVTRKRFRMFFLLLFVIPILFWYPLDTPVPVHTSTPQRGKKKQRRGRKPVRAVRISSRSKSSSAASLSPAAHQAETEAKAKLPKRNTEWVRTSLPPSTDVTAPLWTYSNASPSATSPYSAISVRRDYTVSVAVWYQQRECKHLTTAVRKALATKLPTLDRVGNNNDIVLHLLQDTLADLRICGGVSAPLKGPLSKLRLVDLSYHPSKPMPRSWIGEVLYHDDCSGICSSKAKYCPSCRILREKLYDHQRYLARSVPHKRNCSRPAEEVKQAQVCYFFFTFYEGSFFFSHPRMGTYVSMFGMLWWSMFMPYRKNYESSEIRTGACAKRSREGVRK